MLAFNFFFLPPVHTLTLRDSNNWLALAVFVVTGDRRRHAGGEGTGTRSEAEQRERETALVADVATAALRGPGSRVSSNASPRERPRRSGSRAPASSSARVLLTPTSRRTSSGRMGTLYARPTRSRRSARGSACCPRSARCSPSRANASSSPAKRSRQRRCGARMQPRRRCCVRSPMTPDPAGNDRGRPRLAREWRDRAAARDRAALLESIRIEHSRLKRLVEDLLDLSRLQAGAADRRSSSACEHPRRAGARRLLVVIRSTWSWPTICRSSASTPSSSSERSSTCSERASRLAAGRSRDSAGQRNAQGAPDPRRRSRARRAHRGARADLRALPSVGDGGRRRARAGDCPRLRRSQRRTPLGRVARRSGRIVRPGVPAVDAPVEAGVSARSPTC